MRSLRRRRRPSPLRAADSRQLVGLLGLRGGAACSAGVINLGAADVSLAVGGLQLLSCSVAAGGSGNGSVLFDSYWADVGDVARQGLTVPELQHAAGAVDGSAGVVVLPAYSITTIAG